MFNAAGQMDKNNHYIFTGTPRSCSLAPVGFLNCCADSGWGDELGFKCDVEEKQLLKDKGDHLVLQILGDYCDKEVGGICLSKRKRYCVFPSRIARLIQEKGRRDQLHINFGTPEDPRCTGITPEELQKIDFAKIDFTEIADEMRKSMPADDVAAVSERIKQRVKELGEPHA
jgi:conjugal transfer mating pair stabilization protein TraN